MASVRCKECDKPVVWATLKNGKFSGKKRPFDAVDDGTGRFGIAPRGEKNKFGYDEYDATEYDDPIKGLEFNERLFSNHFDTCPNKKSRGSYSGGGGKVYVTVEVAGKYYGGYVSPIKTDDPPNGSREFEPAPENTGAGVQSTFDDDL